MRHFAKNIKFLISRSGIKNKDLAEKLGWQPQVISSYTTGAAIPPLPKLIALAEFFDVKIDNLINTDLATSVATSIPSLDDSDVDALIARTVRVYDSLLQAKDQELTDVKALYVKLKKEYPDIIKKMEAQ
jgi:transcriptional regulator with XRE-family HTH domain